METHSFRERPISVVDCVSEKLRNVVAKYRYRVIIFLIG